MSRIRKILHFSAKTYITTLLVAIFVLAQAPIFNAYEAHVINVTARIEPLCEEGYRITGFKFNDLNQNGVRDDSEPALAGWIISLQKGPYQAELDYDDSGYTNIADYVILSDVLIGNISCPVGKDCDLDDDTDTDTDDLDILFDYITSHDLGSQLTGSNGSYTFTYGVTIGDYIIRETPESGWSATTLALQYLAVSDCETVVNFGNFRAGSECPALSIGYWKNHEGCPQSSNWTNEVNDFSQNNLLGVFTDFSGEEICTTLAPSNCPPGGTVVGQLCRAQGKALADILNIVSNNLDPYAVIAGADDGSSAFDNLGLNPNSTILEALIAIETIINDPNHTKAQLADANHVGERIYTFYEDENPSFPACLYSWDQPSSELQSTQGLILGSESENSDNSNDNSDEPKGNDQDKNNEPTPITTEPLLILGCTDQTASNYNQEATEDDGSCNYPEPKPAPTTTPPLVIFGCTDQTALNYNSEAAQDDNSCTYQEPELTPTTTPPIVILGCTDQTATNYNPQATEDDGSCTYHESAPEILPPEPIIEE